MTELEQPNPQMRSIGNGWTRRLFDGPFYISSSGEDSRPTCSLVFVQSADGNTGADNPESLGGGETDKHLIYEGLSRAGADAVLAGASTVRGADVVFSVWHPECVALRESLSLPRHPWQLVATRRGIDIDDTLLFNVPDIPALVVTGADGFRAMRPALVQRPWVRTVVLERHENLRTAFAQLRALGLRQVSCVGGRDLARQLFEAALVDDLYLTTSPRPGGEPGTPLMEPAVGGRTIIRKRGTGPEAGVVFEHRVAPYA